MLKTFNKPPDILFMKRYYTSTTQPCFRSINEADMCYLNPVTCIGLYSSVVLALGR